MVLLLARYATTLVFALIGMVLLLDPATRRWARDVEAY
jgi:hypothetical protein